MLEWRGKEVVNISRAFLDTNGAHQETDVEVEMPCESDNYLDKISTPAVAKMVEAGDMKGAWEAELEDLNVCSQKGLVEMFDGSIGAGSVYMPYGGRYQLTETQSMVAKLPVLKGKCDTVTMMAYGFDPYLSSWSPYHGSIYAVLESISRIVAAGGDYSKIRMTYQEYFRRMNEDQSAGVSRLQHSSEHMMLRLASDFLQSVERILCQVPSMILMYRLHSYHLQLMWQRKRISSHLSSRKRAISLFSLR